MKSKLNVSQRIAAKCSAGLVAVSGFLLVAGSCLPSATQTVLADAYQNQINALNAQNDKTQAAIAGLQTQAASYQAVIDNLQSQIHTLQASIAANQAKQASLQQQIIDDQNQIDHERAVLADDVKTMYVDGTPTTLEILATSKNLSQFVDKQEYRTSVQNRLNDTLKAIAQLQSQLQSQKQQVDALIVQLRGQQSQLVTDQAQEQTLLNDNQAQQSAYVAQVQANNSKIAEIQRERAAAIARISGSNGRSAVGALISYEHFQTSYSTCGGGYSYCWAGFDQVVNDPWGLDYAHECVHFVADWLTRHGYQVPNFNGTGNANEWSEHAQIISSSQVQVGDVAYMPLAPIGHVGVVTAVDRVNNPDYPYHIEQMNWPVGGYYSEMDLSPQNITFLRFPH